MLEAIIRFSLNYRLLIVMAAILLLVGGLGLIPDIPIDVFPDLTAPTVTILTEASGMAPEEVELLVTFPLESVLNGAPGIRRVRSVSAAGLSVIWAEFDWTSEIYRARQIVSERLQGIELPARVDPPRMGPVSSIMGEITFLALTSETVSPMELRRLADTVVRRALLAIPGISQVVPIGGEVREFQVEADPLALGRHGVTVDELSAALAQASDNPAAGFHVDGGQEYLVRGLGRVRRTDELGATVVRLEEGVPLTVDRLADVRVGAEPQRGTASYSTRPAVVVSVQKQPGANTLTLTRQIEEVIGSLSTMLPEGVVIETENFRQADFIEVAVSNVSAAMRDGAVLVVLVLFLFLGNIRTTFIAAVAIPLSVVTGILTISWLGGTINTMSLGGLTIAVGALVDDAIIGVENVFRRLREERRKPEHERDDPLKVVFRASSEVRRAILYATLIIVLVFLPLFFLPGLEGRLLAPLGLAYVISLAASLVVSITLTPVLCYFMLRKPALLDSGRPWLLRRLQAAYDASLSWALAHRAVVIIGTILVTLPALVVVFFLGRSFLPPFNEGALTLSVVSTPGITLKESDDLGRQVEAALLTFPEVVSTSRRTGRAEKDEHIQGVNAAEMEVVLRPGRPKAELLEQMRRSMATIPGVAVSFGQPISHRIDHMLSGSRANLAVKVFGPDLAVLRRLASQVEDLLPQVPGVVDVNNQEQSSVPQLLIEYDRRAMARHGLTPASLSRTVEAFFQGTVVGEVLDEGIISRVVVRFPERLRTDRESLHALPVPLPVGGTIRLGEVARVDFTLGPSLVRRENIQRTAVIKANVAGTDLAGTVDRVRRLVAEQLDLPFGYRIVYGGQFEEAGRGLRNIGLMSLGVIALMYLLLFIVFRRHRHVLIVMANLPLAMIGGVLAIAVSGGGLNVATLVGFVTLFGIATRSGVLLVTRYQHLMYDQGLTVVEAVVKGSRERMAPILMTAVTAGLALVPLVVRGEQPGNEIQSPMGQVILGGLISATFLNLVLIPVLFNSWGGARLKGESPAG
jgi:CzcA family heavy metal efflux pump